MEAQTLEDFAECYKEYIRRDSQSTDSSRALGVWIADDTIMGLEQRNKEHKKYGFLPNLRVAFYIRFSFRVCVKMQAEVCT